MGKPTDNRPLVREAFDAPVRPTGKVTITVSMIVLALGIGFVIGFLVFLVVKLSTWLTGLVWNGHLQNPGSFVLFPLVVCAVGGLIIGLWTHFSKNSVKPLHQVMAEFKATGSYKLGGAGKGVVSFLLPLVFGGSVGFEAGLTGIVTAACCWIRDRLKLAGLRAAAVADTTIAASLSAIFGAPLAGIIAGVESSRGGSATVEPSVDDFDMRRSTKLVLYAAAAFGAFAGLKVFSAIFGAAAGLPHFGELGATGAGYLWALAALAVAYVLVLVNCGSDRLFAKLSQRLDHGSHGTIIKPLVAGAIMGAIAMALPYVLFPGEEQSRELIQGWASWGAVALLGTGVLKAFVTPLCLRMGWVGGNFFPAIFAGAACGYGLSAITGADPALMVTVTTAAYLAGVTRKPVLTIGILLLCFPLDAVVWMGVAAILGSILPVPSILRTGGDAKGTGRLFGARGAGGLFGARGAGKQIPPATKRYPSDESEARDEE